MKTENIVYLSGEHYLSDELRNGDFRLVKDLGQLVLVLLIRRTVPTSFNLPNEFKRSIFNYTQ